MDSTSEIVSHSEDEPFRWGFQGRYMLDGGQIFESCEVLINLQENITLCLRLRKLIYFRSCSTTLTGKDYIQ